MAEERVINTEKWKDIKGYEGVYQVSNTGRVRSLDRTQLYKNGRIVSYEGKTLKQSPNSRGYMRVCLRSGKGYRQPFVHRLVAEHFVPNDSPGELPVVNHKDSNHLNNHADNLEWTTILGNNHHAIANGRMQRTDKWIENLNKSLEKHYKPVVGYDPISGMEVVAFNSIQECGRHGFDVSCVCDCCKGKRKTHKGLVWRYADVVVIE